jgi:hypothetical protein
MAKTDAWENGLLLLVFNNVAFTAVGDAGGLLGSAVAGSLFVSLHTADPGEAGSQNTSEASYTGYARVAVARSASGWTVSGSVVRPTSEIVFPVPTGGTGTFTFFGVGTASSGTGRLLYHPPIVSPVGGHVLVLGQAPRMTTATSITES